MLLKIINFIKEYWWAILQGIVFLFSLIQVAKAAKKIREKNKAEEAKAKEEAQAAEEAKVEEAPVEETKAEEVPVVEEPKEEEKVEEAKPEEEAKAEEPVVEETKDEEAPVVEEPKEEEPAPAKTEEEAIEAAIPDEAAVEQHKEEQHKEEEPVVEERVYAHEAKKTEKKEVPKKEVKPKEQKKEEPKEEVPTPKKKEKTMCSPDKKKTIVGKFAISYDASDDDYRYRLYASNGELMVVSEIYTSKRSCLAGIETLKKNARPENIEFVEDKHNLFSFRVLSESGSRCLITSANYPTKASVDKAAQSFLKNVVTEKIVDEEKDDHNEEEFADDVEAVEGGKFKIIADGEDFYYHLFANNGQLIAASNHYKTKKGCMDALEKFKALVYEGKFFIFKDKNSKYQFKLYNTQKRMMVAGEVYDTRTKVVNVITSIKRFTKDAQLVEE